MIKEKIMYPPIVSSSTSSYSPPSSAWLPKERLDNALIFIRFPTISVFSNVLQSALLLLLLLLFGICARCTGELLQTIIATTTTLAPTTTITPTATTSQTLATTASHKRIAFNGSTSFTSDGGEEFVVGNSFDFTAENIAANVNNVTASCVQRCRDEDGSFLDEFGIKCPKGTDDDEKCFFSRCTKGCQNWWRALQEYEPCQEACSSLQFFPYDLPCITACEMAQRQYWHLQRLAMEATIVSSSRPQLLHDVESCCTLTLQWSIDLAEKILRSSIRPFNIQYLIVNDRREGEGMEANIYGDIRDESFMELNKPRAQQWCYLAHYNCGEDFSCDILDGLLPYTSYRFRFELLFGENEEDVLYSPPTDIFHTPAEGPPLSRPVIEHVISLDESHIALYWKPGDLTNGPLKGYKLIVENSEGNLILEELLSEKQEQYILADLKPLTNYTLRLCMTNAEGCGPETQVNFTTKLASPGEMEDANLSRVILIGEHTIEVKSLEPLVDTQLVYRSHESIRDFSMQLSTNRIFVVDAEGGLLSAHLDRLSEREVLYLNRSGIDFKPAKISMDWLNLKLYLAGETNDRLWSVVCTDLDGNDMNTITKNIISPIKQLEIDPINGWLFMLQAEGVLQRLNLATKVHEVVIKNVNLTSFSIDFSRNLLIICDGTGQTLLELSFDGSFQHYFTKHVFGPSAAGNILRNSGSLGIWQSFGLSLKGLNSYVTNGTHLIHSKAGSNEPEIWPIGENISWCYKIKPLAPLPSYNWQPHPHPSGRPEHVQVLLTSNRAKVSWQLPMRYPFQTSHVWQQWQYELELMDMASNSAFNIRNIRSQHFEIEQLQPDNLYRIRVRAESRRLGGSLATDSEWSEVVEARTWPRGEHRLIWAAPKGIYETTLLSEQPKLFFEIEPNETNLAINDFLQLNSTIFYLANKTLLCANIMNPELNCLFRPRVANAPITGVAYDWRAMKIYWIDKQRNIVLRAYLDGSDIEMLPIFDTKEIVIDSYRGFIYYSTSNRLCRRLLAGDVVESASSREIEYFHVNGFGETISSFALNLEKQLLFWIVAQQENDMKLYWVNIAQWKSSQNLQEVLLDGKVVEGSLKFIPEIESLMWLQASEANAKGESYVVFARVENLSHRAVLDIPSSLGPPYAVQLKSPYVPYMDPTVIPDAVDARTIRIDEGSYWDDFSIKWSPVTAADNYTVFYRVLLQFSDESGQLSRFYTLSTTEPLLRINEFQSPLLHLEVSITTHTPWCAGSTVSAQLRTPAAEPTQPRHLRVFIRATPQPLLSLPNISALVRWNPPDNVSNPVAYKVYCWLGEELMAERLHNSSREQQFLEASFGDLLVGQTYTFQVQAFISGRRSRSGDHSAIHSIHINPEVQAVPMLVFANNEYIAELDMDLNRSRILVHTTSAVEHLTMIQSEQRLLWVNENVELLTFVPGSTPIKLARMRAEVLALTVDWIARRVYWAEINNKSVTIYGLDLCLYEGRVMTGRKLHTTENGKTVRQLVMQPFLQTLLWLEFEQGIEEQGADFIGRNLSDGSITHYLNNKKFRSMFEGSLSPDIEKVNLVDVEGNLCAYDVKRQLCMPLKLNISGFGELLNVGRDNGYIYALHNGTVRAYNVRKQRQEYKVQIEDAREIRTYNYQEYPARECLLPSVVPTNATNLLRIQALEAEENRIVLKLPTVRTDGSCWLPVPGVRYLVTVYNDNQEVHLNTSQDEKLVNITQLKAFTNYTVQLRIFAYYQQKLGFAPLHVPEFIIQTAVGTPSMPRNFSVQAISPTEIEVQWTEPEELNCDHVWYELHWKSPDENTAAHIAFQNNENFFIMTNMLPGSSYTLWLGVYSTKGKFNATRTVAVQTFDQPRKLELVMATAYNLTLNWLPAGNINRTLLLYRPINSFVSESVSEAPAECVIDITNNSALIVIADLIPHTRYQFALQIFYDGVKRSYRWPEKSGGEEIFIFETLGDKPSKPGRPEVEHITGEIFKVFWAAAENNGAPIIEYHLEALQSRNPTPKRIRRHANGSYSFANQSYDWLNQLPWVEEPEPLEDKWLVFCRTSALSCIVRDLHTMRLLMFRVRARNEPYGWGPYSEESERVSEPFVSPEKRSSLVLAIIAPAVIVSACVLLLVVFRAIQNRRLRAKKLLEKSHPTSWRSFSTMHQQQQQQLILASRNRALSVASHSTLYTGGPLSDADIALLPHVSWNQITLLNFIGSGAFGEVYEGLVKHEDGEEPEKVAIKSLRKGSNEFAELLQEAQLMSNFKHENIVRLIGVCCDSESISIIMEHMEGGDLLSTLRESRPNSLRPIPTLRLRDLIAMCIDVATGCSYLENMHFVHRDLACRNCLVSSRDPIKRIVKIGDFGLTRELYKSDYYRKEGEGLLPVRWMSPESLVDGVFSTQSDVWAFGVLCWEILTLGQQPYAARNNLDVLHFVKKGGRLEQPDNCPDKLFSLMQQAWKTDPVERPSFRKCLSVLQAIKTDFRNIGIERARCDDVFPGYANNQTIALSTFLAKPPLPKLDEHVEPFDERRISEANIEKNISVGQSVFEDTNFCKDEDNESLNDDDSQLIVLRGSGKRELESRVNCYTNEGISRL